MKLSQDFLIPIISKTHDVIELHFLALIHSFNEKWIIHVFIIFPIHILARDNGCTRLTHHNCGIEVLMKLSPKMPLKAFTLVILAYFLLSSLSESHILLVVVSAQSDFKTRNYSGSPEPWNVWIVALLGSELDL